jgi:hypothetical protein
MSAAMENFAPTGIRFPYCPSRSDSLYRLLYPGTCNCIWWKLWSLVNNTEVWHWKEQRWGSRVHPCVFLVLDRWCTTCGSRLLHKWLVQRSVAYNVLRTLILGLSWKKKILRGTSPNHSCLEWPAVKTSLRPTDSDIVTIFLEFWCGRNCNVNVNDHWPFFFLLLLYDV